jgi:hypothetical protein
LGRVQQEGGRHAFAGNGLLVARELLRPLLERIDSERAGTGESAAEWVSANSHRLHRIVAELHETRVANLKVVNFEGDPLEFCSAVYQVQDEAAALAGLRSCGEFEEDVDAGPGLRRFAWLQTGDTGPRRSYGQVELRNGRLRLECNSRNRLERGRGLVEEHAAKALRHLGDSFESLAAAKRRFGPGTPRSESGDIPQEIQREILLKVKEEHYGKWPDEPLPALGGLTPRAAVRNPDGRQAVLELMRDFENHEERRAREGQPAYDFSRVRQVLGLPPV